MLDKEWFIMWLITEAYQFIVRLLITLACLLLVLFTAAISPCFLGAHVIASAAFWRYFFIAVALSFLPVLTA